MRTYTYYPGQEHLPRGVVPWTKNRSYSITAFVDRPDQRTEGVIVALGEFNGGFVLYLKDRKLVFDYNDLGTHTVLASDANVPIGKATLRFAFTKTGDWKGTGTLFINDKNAAENTLSLIPSHLFSWEGLDVGRDALSPVTSAYADKGEFAFTPGAIEKVVIRVETFPPKPEPAQELGR